MLRVLGAMLVLIVAASSAGCGGAQDSGATATSGRADATATTMAGSDTTTPETTDSANASDPLAQKFGSTTDLGDLLVTVDVPTDDTANLDETAKSILLEPGEKAIYCMVTIVNNGSEPFAYNTLGFTMYDSEGLTYDSLFPVSTQPDLGSGDLLPGRTVRGAISYAMPEEASPAYVDFTRSLFDTVEASWGN
jgi:hypothetical protein